MLVCALATERCVGCRFTLVAREAARSVGEAAASGSSPPILWHALSRAKPKPLAWRGGLAESGGFSY